MNLIKKILKRHIPSRATPEEIQDKGKIFTPVTRSVTFESDVVAAAKNHVFSLIMKLVRAVQIHL